MDISSKLNYFNELLKEKEVSIELRKRILEKITSLGKPCLTANAKMDVCREYAQTICKETLKKAGFNDVLPGCNSLKELYIVLDKINSYNNYYSFFPEELTLESESFKKELRSYKRNLIIKGKKEPEQISDIDTQFINWITSLIIYFGSNDLEDTDIEISSPMSSTFNDLTYQITDETKTRVATVLLKVHESIKNEAIQFDLLQQHQSNDFDFLTPALLNFTEGQFERIYDKKWNILAILEDQIVTLAYVGADLKVILKSGIRTENNELVLRCAFDKNLLHFIIMEALRYVVQGYISKMALLTRIFNDIRNNRVPGTTKTPTSPGPLVFLNEINEFIKSFKSTMSPTVYRNLVSVTSTE
jgi:hypothetical protein